MIEQARPVEGVQLGVRDVEWFEFTMRRAFGAFPVELDAGHLKTLEGMAAATAAPNPYDAIVKHVKRYGSVRIWRQFDGDDASNGVVKPTIDLPMRESDT